MRQASTFNLLHEAAVIKEMAGSSSALPTFRKAGKLLAKSALPKASLVIEMAKRELIHLQVLPPTSHKWMWGEQLTKAKV